MPEGFQWYDGNILLPSTTGGCCNFTGRIKVLMWSENLQIQKYKTCKVTFSFVISNQYLPWFSRFVNLKQWFHSQSRTRQSTSGFSKNSYVEWIYKHTSIAYLVCDDEIKCLQKLFRNEKLYIRIHAVFPIVNNLPRCQAGM